MIVREFRTCLLLKRTYERHTPPLLATGSKATLNPTVKITPSHQTHTDNTFLGCSPGWFGVRDAPELCAEVFWAVAWWRGWGAEGSDLTQLIGIDQPNIC